MQRTRRRKRRKGRRRHLRYCHADDWLPGYSLKIFLQPVTVLVFRKKKWKSRRPCTSKQDCMLEVQPRWCCR